MQCTQFIPEINQRKSEKISILTAKEVHRGMILPKEAQESQELGEINKSGSHLGCSQIDKDSNLIAALDNSSLLPSVAAT